MNAPGGKRSRQRWRRAVHGAVVRLALLAAALGLVLGVLEIGLRLFWDGFYLKTPKGYAHSDPVRGWANRPDVSVPYGEPEFHTIVTHNHFGYRSPPVEHERTPGRVRVLVLGDSFAYGVGVQDRETFSAGLESLAPELEVIDTGVNGYGTSQELLLLRDEGLAFQPDVVLVAFFWNDVANSYTNRAVHFALEGGELRYPPAPAPTPSPAEAAARAADFSAAPSAERRDWLRHSYAYRFLSDRAKLLGYWSKFALGLPLERGDIVSASEREDAWQLELALLREIDRMSREHGAHMLLLLIPDQVQVQPDVRVFGVPQDVYDVQGRLHAFADQAGIAVVDPLRALRAAYAAHAEPLYYLRDRHLRAAGHALVAREILARLRELGWASPGRLGATAASPRGAPGAAERELPSRSAGS
jgi:hypothetical protein